MEHNKALKASVLAAGKGKRMHTEGCDLPKVLRVAKGRPLLAWVLDALAFIPPEDTVLVVGYQREQVLAAFPGYASAVQEQQLGTGHAVMAAFSALGDYRGDLLVCYGDMPLLRRETYEALIAYHREREASCTILTGEADIPLPYGRILRAPDGSFAGVVEDRDCTPEQKAITELNCGVYVFDAPSLASVLGSLRQANAQGEYYLTDAPLLLQEAGKRVEVCRRDLGMEILGVNTPEQLAEVESLLP